MIQIQRFTPFYDSDSATHTAISSLIDSFFILRRNTMFESSYTSLAQDAKTKVGKNLNARRLVFYLWIKDLCQTNDAVETSVGYKI